MLGNSAPEILNFSWVTCFTYLIWWPVVQKSSVLSINAKQHNKTRSWRQIMTCYLSGTHPLLNTLRPRQNGRHFADDTFKSIFMNENVWISINISLKFVPRGAINNIPTLVQVMAWRRPGDKPLSEPMMVRLPTHICVTRPQWVKPMMTYCHLGEKFG